MAKNLQLKEIRVRNAARLATEIFFISKNLGISMAELVRPKLRELADSYPEHMKKQKIN